MNNKTNSILPWLFSLWLSMTSAVVAEVKAEPQSVQLKHGSAVLKGTVGDDEHYEHEDGTTCD